MVMKEKTVSHSKMCLYIKLYTDLLVVNMELFLSAELWKLRSIVLQIDYLTFPL